eukprot:CAMPEP_0202865320 /NCGR_PEP_ID=MMETSP1391-20130828/5655_1 /ASSEMBLY_ACC=CAM_ASM_000867 /TAXON_ID=1034604 /ORGANISM="Chlamydomonas leiostraca, Strain SAG 11-49" /LENGTH=530 /DNA_ID=CAMNT_0049545149 /DNA_START=14 /DNA_END=1606 /DNA_ORIENTATION=-
MAATLHRASRTCSNALRGRQAPGLAVACKPVTCGRKSCNARVFSNVERGQFLWNASRSIFTTRTAAAAAAADAPVAKDAEKAKDTRIPVTVITGFLGAGKTTLLNNILTKNHGRRIAVIENEFGEIDIDSELVVKQEAVEGTRDTVMQLSNGCLCCTVRDDLIQALNRLYDRKGEFDHIVIETTGLANPAPIISSFYMDQSLPDKVRLDGVVTVVDAKHVVRHLDDKKEEDVVNEAVTQIAYADRIILNKTDLVSPQDLAVLEGRLRAINKMADITRTQRAQVAVDYVLGVGGFDLENVEKELNVTLRRDGQIKEHDHHHHHHHEHSHDCAGANCSHESHKHDHDHAHASHSHDGHECSGKDCGHESHKHEHSHDHGHGHAHASHSHDHEHAHSHDCSDPHCSHESHGHGDALHQHHDDKVASVSLVLEGSMDLDKINYSLGLLLETRSEDIYRMKGLLAIHGSEYRYVYQGVHTMFEGTPDRTWKDGEKRVCKMVFIGRELDREAFKDAFEHCLVKEDSKAQQPATASA